MRHTRLLVWLIAVIAFVAPSLGSASMAHAGQSMDQSAGQSTQQVASADCPDHAPPPDCPAEGTAKHAAGKCCPLMAGVVALVPPVAAAQTRARFHARPATVALNLIGLDFTQDPPPPRV